MVRSDDFGGASEKKPPGQKAAETRRRRQEERATRAWMGQLGVLMDTTPYYDTHWLIRCEINDGDIEAALDQAIADVGRAMQPLTPRQIFSHVLDGIEDPRPLEYDVALTHGGKILAVIQATADGPVVTRLGR